MSTVREPSHVWYVAYGSNMRRERLACYVVGGQPTGCTRTYLGSRDRTPPALGLPIVLPGAVAFAGWSPVWGGGVAFYDPSADDLVAAVAYLVTAQQFSDIASQEAGNEAGVDLDLGRVLCEGFDVLDPGPYRTLLLLGRRDGFPLLTFTSAIDPTTLRAPSDAYAQTIAAGLVEHGWAVQDAHEYLVSRPGWATPAATSTGVAA